MSKRAHDRSFFSILKNIAVAFLHFSVVDQTLFAFLFAVLVLLVCGFVCAWIILVRLLSVSHTHTCFNIKSPPWHDISCVQLMESTSLPMFE